MSVRSVFPRRAVIQSAMPADRTSRRPSVDRRCARLRAGFCLRAGVARGATRKQAERSAAEALPCLGPHQRGSKPWVLVGFRAPISVDAGLPVARDDRGDSARKLVTGPLGRSGPQVLCRGVGNDLLRPLSLSRRCPLHWADGPAFTGGWLYLKRELRTSRTTGDHGRRAPPTDV